MIQKCPCCSGESYDSCCKPLHDGVPPSAPLALMRSRYSAYALAKPLYIIRTTHPKSIYYEKDRKKWEEAILAFSHSTKFLHLDILDYGEDWVEFRAQLLQKDRSFSLKEKSRFEKVNDQWLYLSGEISIEENT